MYCYRKQIPLNCIFPYKYIVKYNLLFLYTFKQNKYVIDKKDRDDTQIWYDKESRESVSVQMKVT